MSDLVNDSLSLSEEDAVGAAAIPAGETSRLSPEPPAGAPAEPEVAAAPAETEVPRLAALASEAVDELPGGVKRLMRLQPPTHKLIAITTSMSQHLTSLLVSIFQILTI